MSGRAAYMDTSAFVKLIVAEPSRRRSAHACDAGRTVCPRPCCGPRPCALCDGPATILSSARLVVCSHRSISSASTNRYSTVPATSSRAELRSLDAVHLAAALSIGPNLGVLVTYDDRLREAALTQGLDVESPGR